MLGCVTIAPEAARSLGAKLAAQGLVFLDTPVSGGFAAARGGTMTVMASGPDAGFIRAQPVLDAIAAKVWRLGEEVGTGSTVKMVNQLLAGVHIATAAEAMALGIRAGADPQVLFDVISTSAGSSWMFQNRVPHILAGDDTPLSSVNIFVKDLGIVLDQARALTFPLPMAWACVTTPSSSASGRRWPGSPCRRNPNRDPPARPAAARRLRIAGAETHRSAPGGRRNDLRAAA